MRTLTDSWRGIHKPVFIPASIVILGLVAFAAVSSQTASDTFTTLNATITDGVGWWYILAATVFVVFAIFCAFSRVGSIRLGRDDEKPEFGMFSWFAMLFSAGMGIGLVFYGVAEPLSHFVIPPQAGRVPPGTDEAANQAMELTLFHWGLHAWSIYVVVGLGLAYMTYRKGRPLSVRWLLEPLFGRKAIEGALGHAIDAIAVIGTLFGVATSLGIGVTQIAAGLGYLGWLEVDATWTVVIIAIITAIATFSVVTGVTKGLKWLSNINMVLAAVLALFVLLLGPTLFILTAFVQNLGGYVGALPEMMLRTAPWADDTWLGDWTIFYWGWWVSWAPFVGMFIARISRGRTIREFITGVLVAPTLIGALWFTIFGETGILRTREEIAAAPEGRPTEGLATWDAGTESVWFPEGGFSVNSNTALFQLLADFPLAQVTSVLAIVVIVFFFVTSSDSGSLVIDILSTGGDLETPKLTRVYWAVLEGVAAAVLLLVGGTAEDPTASLTALQTASIATAVPFSIIMVLACAALLKAFRYDLATTPRYLRVATAGDAPVQPEPEGSAPPGRRRGGISTTFAGLAPSREGISTPQAGGLVVAVQDIPGHTVAVDPRSGAVEVADDALPSDPLNGEVFDTPEFAASAEAARLEREEPAPERDEDR
ncbi:BCCT family transporter [Desertihabitans brevis]|uniref:BCCT family transporter n=1 Tax=Desertihabitans brevis TaxID=2268447 RepID=A0A367YUA6_9ACTN|nr:BCCT family transporter [Desertihabitans brevis]RCK69475.1 BCCT family transporter [Desertihabitans brevis]